MAFENSGLSRQSLGYNTRVYAIGRFMVKMEYNSTASSLAITIILKLATDNLVDALGEYSMLPAVQASHRDTSVMSHVDMSFLGESLGLRGIKPQ